jgi:3-phenylpropionate/trans-cinnamate dioxygenase ferredoxin reductase component
VSGSAQQFVIVGGGQSGAWVARTLRAEGFSGRLLMIGEERHWPYERPPLSKSVLLGGGPEDEGVLLSELQATTLGIETRLGHCVTTIDRIGHLVICADGRAVPYDKLFLATGSRPRLLPQAEELDRRLVHYLRTRDDAHRLRTGLMPGQRLAVVGGGWIGLEVAASASQLGVRVTVLEAASRVCARSVPSPVSAYLQRLHAQHGVQIHLSSGVHALHGQGDGVSVALEDGHVFDVDQILVGIGVLPNTELAKASGLDIDNGIVVDSAGRTSDPDVFAAGDVTAHFNRFSGRRIRLESWANAQSQGVIAAQAALGKVANYDEIPWIWSDQFGVNLQSVGFPDQAAFILHRGAPEAGNGCWLMLDKARAAVGAVAVNAPRELRAVRKALQARSAVDLSTWTANTV